MRPAINLSGLEHMPEAWQVKWSMIDTAEYDFWVGMIENTLKIARKIPNVTDDFLRKKAYAYRSLAQFEMNRARLLLAAHQLTPNALRSVATNHPVRAEYDVIMRRARRFEAAAILYADVLYARLYLKGANSIVAYIVRATVPEEVGSRLRQMEEEFPAI